MVPNQSVEQTSFYIHTIINDVAASLMIKFQKMAAEFQALNCIYSPPPLETEDVQRQKKKIQGRLYKLFGDLCLLAGSVKESTEK